MSTEDTKHPVSDLLPWYLNETLSQEEQQQVQGHLTNCADCRAELEEMRQLQGAIQEGSVKQERPSSTVFRRVMDRIREQE